MTFISGGCGFVTRRSPAPPRPAPAVLSAAVSVIEGQSRGDERELVHFSPSLPLNGSLSPRAALHNSRFISR